MEKILLLRRICFLVLFLDVIFNQTFNLCSFTKQIFGNKGSVLKHMQSLICFACVSRSSQSMTFEICSCFLVVGLHQERWCNLRHNFCLCLLKEQTKNFWGNSLLLVYLVLYSPVPCFPCWFKAAWIENVFSRGLEKPTGKTALHWLDEIV